MSNPLTVTVDLSALGMRYDEEGDPAGRQSFEDAVIEAAAAKLLSDNKETRHALKERVQRIRDEELRAAIASEVRAAMDLPIQRTSQWGEAKGDPVTIRELIRLELEKFLSSSPRGNDYRSSSDKTPRNLDEMIREVANQALRQEFETEVREARKAVTEKVTELALAATQRLIAKPR